MVPVTRDDVRRLQAHTGRNPATFVHLRSPTEVDLEGEPESLALLPEGHLLPALAQDGDGACIFLRDEPDGRASCSVHDARPRSCRAYPFDRPLHQGEELGLHPGALCPPETGHLPVLDEQSERPEWAAVVRERDRELAQHAEWIARWNQRQRLRMRMGKARLPAAELLRLLGEPGRPSSDQLVTSSGVLTQDAAHATQIGSAEQVDVNE